MSKSFKFLGLIVLLVGLMAGSAFAGASQVNHAAANTVPTIGIEALGAARNVEITGPGGGASAAANGAITYTLTQAVTAGNFLGVTFTSANFTGNAVQVCRTSRACPTDGAGLGRRVGTGTPAAGANTYNFQLSWDATLATNNLAVGDVLTITNAAACNDALVNVSGARNLFLNIPAQSTATNGSVVMQIVSAGNISVDPATTAQLTGVITQLPTGATNTQFTIDFLATPFNGTRFTNTNATANAPAAANFEVIPTDFGAAIGSTNNFALTVAGVVKVTDTQAWQGVSKVFIGSAAAGGCNDTAAGNIVGAGGSLNGTLTFAVPVASFSGIANSPATSNGLCVQADGTTMLNTRIITNTRSVTATGGYNGTSGSATVQQWLQNAYQASLPYSSTNSAWPSYCLINNTGATNVNVIFDVLSSENSTQNMSNNLGTINARTSALVTISGATVSMAGSNSTATVTGTAVRHADRITVTGAPATAGNGFVGVNAACFQTDAATGGKRNVLTLH